jgi:hypothetical protein
MAELSHCMPFFVETCPASHSCQKSKVTTLALVPEHSQSNNMHKTLVARQGEYGLSFILSLEAP